ncbi:hypothetical protein N9V86_04180, partial [Opitutales bacterium]|nr:hypothetical protein [Opitutales bacterium]
QWEFSVFYARGPFLSIMLAEEYLEGLAVNLFLLSSLKKESQLGTLDLLFARGRDDPPQQNSLPIRLRIISTL